MTQTAQNAAAAENYLKAAKAFVLAREGGFLIALAPGKKQGAEFAASVRQWGAWRAYFKTIGHRQMVRFMDWWGTEKNACLTVPAEWPHLFDAAATVQGDHEAGERFARNHRPERIDIANQARRMATVAAYRSRLPQDKISSRDALLDGYEREFGGGS